MTGEGIQCCESLSFGWPHWSVWPVRLLKTRVFDLHPPSLLSEVTINKDESRSAKATAIYGVLPDMFCQFIGELTSLLQGVGENHYFVYYHHQEFGPWCQNGCKWGAQYKCWNKSITSEWLLLISLRSLIGHIFQYMYIFIALTFISAYTMYTVYCPRFQKEKRLKFVCM